MKEIELTNCQSSNVAAHGFDAETNTLAIKFNGSEKVYHYPDFDEKTYEELTKAKSIGSFVSKVTKGRKFNIFEKK